MNGPGLVVEGLVVRFGDLAAVDGVDLTVGVGEVVCLLGPSGCGKSTILNLIAGLARAQSGRFLIRGQPSSGIHPDIGYVFQRDALLPWRTVLDNVCLGPELRGVPREERVGQAEALIRKVGLTRFEHHYPHELSGGMRKRCELIRTLINRSSILLMDEPFGALDAQTRARMQTHLLDIWRNIDVTILFITHDLDEAIFLADRILVLKANPGAVQELIEVPVPRPRDYSQVNTPEFVATKARLEALIHPKEAVAIDDGVRPHMIRMTDVSDNVE